ncbi:MAG: hypothetical protein E4G98_03710 [Promethearchaeota archaeon]|nr:MAG: hypothetical protein E4G98_03710 [Candidatus Lokiarchaeota archaeon]
MDFRPSPRYSHVFQIVFDGPLSLPQLRARQLRKSWKHLLSDGYINAVFAHAEHDPETANAATFRRIGYGLLQWRPLILHFNESFAFARKYTTMGNRMARRPTRQSQYLRQIESDFEKVRQLYKMVGDPLQQRPEQIFHPGLSAHTPSINDLCDHFLKENTPQYKNLIQVELAEFQQAKLIAPGFRFAQWQAVLPFLENNLDLRMPNPANFKTYRPKRSQGSWVFPIVDPQSIHYKILIGAHSGPNLLSSGLHEMGHAIHYQNMPMQVPFLDRFVGDNFLTETIADVFASLGSRPDFLKDVWDLPFPIVQAMTRSAQRLATYSKQKYALDLKFRIELFSTDWDIVEGQAIYHDYLQKYMGLDAVSVNNFHITFRPFLPGDYFLANLYSQRIEHELSKFGGNRWWQSRNAGAWLQDHWFHFGLANPLPYPEWIS